MIPGLHVLRFVFTRSLFLAPLELAHQPGVPCVELIMFLEVLASISIRFDPS